MKHTFALLCATFISLYVLFFKIGVDRSVAEDKVKKRKRRGNNDPLTAKVSLYVPYLDMMENIP